jgi:hypothetical protein
MLIQKVGRCIAFLSLGAFAIAAPKISATHATTTWQVQNPKYPDQKTNSGNPDANDPDSPNNPNNAHGPDKPVNNKPTKPNTPKSSNKTRKSKRTNPNKKETEKLNEPVGPGGAGSTSVGPSQGDSDRATGTR